MRACAAQQKHRSQMQALPQEREPHAADQPHAAHAGQAVHPGGTPTRLNHLAVQIVTLAGALAHAGKHGETTCRAGRVEGRRENAGRRQGHGELLRTLRQQQHCGTCGCWPAAARSARRAGISAGHAPAAAAAHSVLPEWLRPGSSAAHRPQLSTASSQPPAIHCHLPTAASSAPPAQHPPCPLATLLISSMMSTVLPTPAPPNRPILPPFW